MKSDFTTLQEQIFKSALVGRPSFTTDFRAIRSNMAEVHGFHDAPVEGFEPEVEHAMRWRALQKNPRFGPARGRIKFALREFGTGKSNIAPLFSATMGDTTPIYFKFPMK